MSFKISHTFDCDVLIVGAGLAGIRAAYDLLISGKKVFIVSSQRMCSGSSFSPFNSSLRAQLPISELDIEDYTISLVTTGRGLASDNMYNIIAKEITNEIDRLKDFNIDVTYHKNRAACFAERKRLLAQFKNWKEIREKVESVFFDFGDLFTIIDYSDLQKLIKENNCIKGGLFLDNQNKFFRINSQITILATGGYCGLYEKSLNTKEICGIGHSAAMDVGCDLINMEFQQFIPGLLSPKKNLLFGEILLQYCISIEDEDGNNILLNYLPRDVNLKDCLALRSTHGPFTNFFDSKFFDICMMDISLKSNEVKGLKLKFDPSIMESDNFMIKDITEFYLKNGINLAYDTIEITPFAHCANGGILIDNDGKTNVENLFAAGECTGGIHGADRQGGVATATSLVFGARAAKKANSLIKVNDFVCNKSNFELMDDFINWTSKGDGNCPLSQDILRILAHKLWITAGIIRSESITRPSYEWVCDMLEHYNSVKQIENGQELKIVFKTFHSLRVAKVILKSILERKESRGSHYRADYPLQNNQRFNSCIVVNEN